MSKDLGLEKFYNCSSLFLFFSDFWMLGYSGEEHFPGMFV